MKSSKINVSYVPNINAVQCTMPFGVLYGSGVEKISGIIYVSTLSGRPHVLIDENTTEKEAQDTVDWAHGVLNKGVPPL